MTAITDCVEPLIDEVLRLIDSRAHRPLATYRLQFHKEHLTFRDAVALVGYLGDLGVSDVYASPYLKSRSHSDHGYEVVDHARIDDLLGSQADYESYLAALRQQGMSQLFDIVPNHMSVATDENAWWNDILENGPASPFSRFFDIDWNPVKVELHGKVLLPILGEQYGKVLESGQLRLSFQEGAFSLHYFDHAFPLDPSTISAILTHGIDELSHSLGMETPAFLELQSIVTAVDYLPKRSETDAERLRERQRERIVIRGRLSRLVTAEPTIAAFVQKNLNLYNGDPSSPASFDLLDQLLIRQAYRLAHWKTATDEVNYRRFFDINALAAISMEHVEVFEVAHRLTFDMLVRGEISGLRIDHIDGLYHPVEYLWRLQWGYLRALGKQTHAELAVAQPMEVAAGNPGAIESNSTGTDSAWQEIERPFLEGLHARMGGPGPASLFPDIFGGAGSIPVSMHDPNPPALRPPLYVVVEKILGADEPLPRDWPVHGTTGYDFLAAANGLFVERAGLDATTRIYRRFTGSNIEFKEMAYQSKQLILTAAMAGELQLLAHRLSRLSERHRRSRDFTLTALRDALREVLACFPVYRTYIGGGHVPDRDRRVVQWAVAQAKRLNPATDKSIFDFLRGVLLLEQPPDPDEETIAERESFVGRFQQVTSPVMAKGMEDTFFYRYFPLVSLNEVGGEPEHIVDVERFHRDNQERLERWPCSLLASTTHDTKRSEDVRARIAVLSEVPKLWRAALGRWSKMNRGARSDVEGQDAPSRNDEYLFYQNLLGIWPLTSPSNADLLQIVARMQQYMEKATHEAKRRTSWINPNTDYDAAIRRFVEIVLTDSPKNRFLGDLNNFHEKIVDAGLLTALSQQFLKLVSPGVPDIYQGEEIWDFSLVDPDNRRPVDFGVRRSLLAELRQEVQSSSGDLIPLAERLARSPRDNRLKLFATWRTLQYRQSNPELLIHGEYIPLEVQGGKAKHLCAFARKFEDNVAICISPRLIGELTHLSGASEGPISAPLGEIWTDTSIILKEELSGSFRELFTAAKVETGLRLHVRDVLRHFPLALLDLVKK